MPEGLHGWCGHRASVRYGPCRSATPKFRWRSKPTRAAGTMSASCPPSDSGPALLDVALGTLERTAGLPPRHEHHPLELGYQHAVLFVRPGMDLDRAPIGFGARRLDLEHLRLHEQSVAVKQRRGMAQLLRRQVRDRLAAD